MITLIPLKNESRPRDRKRKRLLLALGRTRLHITRKEAVELFVKLQQVLVK